MGDDPDRGRGSKHHAADRGQPPPAALPPGGLRQKLGWRVLAPSAGVEAEERSAVRSASRSSAASTRGSIHSR